MMMAFGFYFCKKNILNDKVTSALSYLLLNLALPCLIISSMQVDFSRDMLDRAIFCLLVFAGIQVLCLILGFLISGFIRLKPPQSGVFKFAMAFPNTIYMGMPVVRHLFGDEGMFITVICSIMFNLTCFTLGAWLLSDKSGDKKRISLKSIITPASIASFVGFGFFVTSLHIWAPIVSTMRSVGGMTTPLSMLVLGAMLSKSSNFAEVFADFRLYVLGFFRLLVAPIAVFFAIRPFVGDSLTLTVLTLLTGMPAAAVLAILAKNMGSDAETSSKAVFLTTMLSMLTLPLLSLFIEYFI